ncbi:hypothetical protein EVAR_76401_1 [Eumeta japonica]|uniref:Uncharacterized protein n=1 Tax=Eumeta variegata TaxID=151549 RepID=A0A4C1T8P2_EUMVA|nr:hypothetical protein EVAR_76401_1 [Eumeta japonica]
MQTTSRQLHITSHKARLTAIRRGLFDLTRHKFLGSPRGRHSSYGYGRSVYDLSELTVLVALYSRELEANSTDGTVPGGRVRDAPTASRMDVLNNITSCKASNVKRLLVMVIRISGDFQ